MFILTFRRPIGVGDGPGGGRVDNKACRRPLEGWNREVRVETFSGYRDGC